MIDQVVLVPCPLQGHINPMLQLASVLHSNGFSITIIHTSFNAPNPKNLPDFNFLFIDDRLSEAEISSPDKTALIWNLNANSETPFEDRIRKMIEEENQRIGCIIYDELAYFAEAGARNWNIPSIIFRTTHALNFLVRSTEDFQLRLHGKIPLPDSTSEEQLQEYPFIRSKDLPFAKFGPLPNFCKVVSNILNIRNSKAIIYNTINCLEEPSLAKLKSKSQIPIFAIGPLHKIIPKSPHNSLLEEDKNCISWLDKQKANSVIYISMGSLASLNEKEVKEMAWGLANSKQPFLWVIRPGLVFGSELTQVLPKGFKEIVGDRGCIVKWAPQKEILRHNAIGGFWSHCGWNSLLESICEGVPLICRPIFGDQKLSGRLVSEVWNVGLLLEKELESGEVERVVKRLLIGKEGEEMRKTAFALKENVELEIREGGSSYNGLMELLEFIRSF